MSELLLYKLDMVSLLVADHFWYNSAQSGKVEIIFVSDEAIIYTRGLLITSFVYFLCKLYTCPIAADSAITIYLKSPITVLNFTNF